MNNNNNHNNNNNNNININNNTYDDEIQRIHKINFLTNIYISLEYVSLMITLKYKNIMQSFPRNLGFDTPNSDFFL
jgi:hypothetical protein